MLAYTVDEERGKEAGNGSERSGVVNGNGGGRECAIGIGGYECSMC